VIVVDPKEKGGGGQARARENSREKNASPA
jgi:hypothetical protein